MDISFRPAAPGDCVNDAARQEIANSLVVTLPQSALEAQDGPCASSDPNNIASVDAEGCVLVPQTVLYREEQTWDASSPSTNLVFDGFAAEGIDATSAALSIHLYLSSTETGVEVDKTGGGTAFIWPSYVIEERSAGQIEISIKNATQDVRVEIELSQYPVPQEQP